MLYRSIRRALAPRNIVATMAVSLSIAGVAVAAIGSSGIVDNSVLGRDIRNATITSIDIQNETILSSDVRNGSLTGMDIRTDSIYGADVKETSLAAVPLLRGHTAFKSLNVAAFTAVDDATGRANAPVRTLLTVGTLSVQAKCFLNTTADVVRGEVYIATSTDGAMFDSMSDTRNGGPTYDAANYLFITTPIGDRQLVTASAANNVTNLSGTNKSDFSALDTSGRWIRGFATVVIRNGTPTGGVGAAGVLEHGCGFFGVAEHSA